MSACLNQVVRGLVGDINGFFNNKSEILRSLFVTRKQFENLIERDCDGNLSGPILGHNFDEHELDFMESFLKTFELGLSQLEDFMRKLNSVQGLLQLDECSILYYLRQILNGPFACAAVDITNLIGGNLNLLQSTNNAIGTLGNAVRSNISTTVYGLEPVNAALDLYNHLPPKMQENIDNGIKSATNVFNYNQEGGVYQYNTLPYIDKLPKERVNSEWQQGFTNFASGNLMLKDITFFNNLKNISDNIFGSIEMTLGVAANKIYKFQKLTNQFYARSNRAYGTLGAVNRLLISLNRTEYTTTNKIIQKECKQIQTDILGTSITNDSTYSDQTMQTNDGIYNLSTLDGQGGIPNAPTRPLPDTHTQGQDIFDTCEEATNRGRELGCEGCHTHRDDNGNLYYMPCNSMEDYLGVLGVSEPDCDNDEDCDNFGF
tara:strand:- start:15392 stop:16684 length:1293 start_codon:yes stop_codon:yes gene_type:complete